MILTSELFEQEEFRKPYLDESLTLEEKLNKAIELYNIFKKNATQLDEDGSAIDADAEELEVYFYTEIYDKDVSLQALAELEETLGFELPATYKKFVTEIGLFTIGSARYDEELEKYYHEHDSSDGHMTLLPIKRKNDYNRDFHYGIGQYSQFQDGDEITAGETNESLNPRTYVFDACSEYFQVFYFDDAVRDENGEMYVQSMDGDGIGHGKYHDMSFESYMHKKLSTLIEEMLDLKY